MKSIPSLFGIKMELGMNFNYYYTLNLLRKEIFKKQMHKDEKDNNSYFYCSL